MHNTCVVYSVKVQIKRPTSWFQIITMISHEVHGVSNHQPICLFNIMVWLRTKTARKPHIAVIGGSPSQKASNADLCHFFIVFHTIYRQWRWRGKDTLLHKLVSVLRSVCSLFFNIRLWLLEQKTVRSTDIRISFFDTGDGIFQLLGSILYLQMPCLPNLLENQQA